MRKLDSCFEYFGGLSSNNDFYKSLVQFPNEEFKKDFSNQPSCTGHKMYLQSSQYSSTANESLPLSYSNQGAPDSSSQQNFSQTINSSKGPSTKRKTRNFSKFMMNTENSIGLKKARIFEEMGKRFFKHARKVESLEASQPSDSEGEVSNPNEPNLFSSTKSVKDNREIPSTPSFALRKDKR